MADRNYWVNAEDDGLLDEVRRVVGKDSVRIC